ncbi:hypothetical protein HCK01_21940, partial [Streptomyces sp. AA8]|uniref:hypothetical protein n=1 Tax=Streptomyces telluris TaxID=2720021 RepID=UPI0014388D6D
LDQALVEADAGDGQAPDWTVQRIEPGTQTILPPGDYAHFAAKPKAGDAAVDVSGITITLENLKISSRPGTARIEIREVATTNTDKWPENPHFTRLALTKFPAPKIPVMAVSDFTADSQEVAAGTTVRLTWNGPSTLDYTVSHGGTPHTVGKSHEYNTTIDRDTTFQLSYVTGGTTHYLTTTVTVKNPKLTGLEVDGGLTVTGSTGVAGLTVGGGLSVTGATDVQGLTVNKDLTAKQALTVSGSTELQALTVDKDLSAKATLTVTGAAGVTGALTVGGFLQANSDITVAYGGTTKFTTSGLTGIEAPYVSVNGNGVAHDKSSIHLENGWLGGGYLWAHDGLGDEAEVHNGETDNARSFWTVHIA